MAKTTKRALSIIERRLQSGSVFATSSRPIPLAEPERWTVRIVNSKISPSHLYDLQADKGWVYAVPEDLAIKPEEIGLHVLDGRVVRGEHGDEVLMKMERADYQAIQKAKDKANRERTFGSKANKAAIVNAAAAEAGGAEGADFLNRAINRISVTDSRERLSADE